MTKVRVERSYSYPAEAVWALIGDFGGLHRWHPYVRRLDLSWEGRIRTLHFHDGSRAVEQLEARSDEVRRYVYALVDGELPVQHCRAALEVYECDAGCRVAWCAEFEPHGASSRVARQQLGQFYDAGLATLAGALHTPGPAGP
jgi:uncharacterized protein YndB with AHSA1/START domain